MSEAEKQSDQAHSDSRLSDTRQVYTSQSHRSEFTGVVGYELSGETDDGLGEGGATASQKGKGRAVEVPFGSPRSSLYGNGFDTDSRSDGENRHPEIDSDLRETDSASLAHSTGKGVAI